MKTKLNLIPEYKKEEIRQRGTLLKVLRWGLELMAIYVIFMAILFSLNYIVKLNLKVNEIKLGPNNITRFKEFKEYDSEIKEMNLKVSEIQKIQSGQLYWSKLFAKIEEIIPEGIIINNFATKDYSAALAGDSNNRDSLIAFREKIEADGCFANVNLPLSYLVAKENLTFQIDFTVKQECLK